LNSWSGTWTHTTHFSPDYTDAAVVLVNWVVALSPLGIVPLGHDTVEELATSVELHDNIPKEGVFG
jgi:hypothetical protein